MTLLSKNIRNWYNFASAPQIVGEFREFLITPSKSVSGKIRDFFSNIYNKVDFVIYFLLGTSIVMKNFYYTFEYSRIIFCVNGFLLYIRSMRLFHANAKLGPKLVILLYMVIIHHLFINELVVNILFSNCSCQRSWLSSPCWLYSSWGMGLRPKLWLIPTDPSPLKMSAHSCTTLWCCHTGRCMESFHWISKTSWAVL